MTDPTPNAPAKLVIEPEEKRELLHEVTNITNGLRLFSLLVEKGAITEPLALGALQSAAQGIINSASRLGLKLEPTVEFKPKPRKPLEG